MPSRGTVHELRPRQLAPKPHKPRRRRPWGTYAIALAAGAMLLVYASAYGGVLKMRHQLATAKASVSHEQQANATLKKRLRYLRSDEYVESVARRELGLVKKGEVLVIVTPPTGKSGRAETPVPPN